MSKTRSVGIISKPHQLADKEAKRLAQWFEKRGVRVYRERVRLPEQNNKEELDTIPKNVDWVIVLGGDGTLLGAARKIGKWGVPILGVNLGGLGFLTEIPFKQMYPVMEMLLKGQLEIESRLMLGAKVLRSEKILSRFQVLNDVVINKGTLSRIIDLNVCINEQFLTTFKADGLIISTPTGSTAYNLAAGGPILYPTVDNIILTPICPFTLTNRPLILPDHDKLTITMGKESEEKVSLTFDGQVGIDFYYGDKINISKSKKKIKLVKSPYQSYFEILREKLMWGGTTFPNHGNR